MDMGGEYYVQGVVDGTYDIQHIQTYIITLI